MGSTTMTLTATIAASAVINSQGFMSIATSPELPTSTEFTIPSGETWIIDDVYILAAADAGTSNPVLKFKKNQRIDIGQTAPMSSLLVSNNSRPKFKPVGYEPVTKMSIPYVTTVANDATIDSLVAYASVDKRF